VLKASILRAILNFTSTELVSSVSFSLYQMMDLLLRRKTEKKAETHT